MTRLNCITLSGTISELFTACGEAPHLTPEEIYNPIRHYLAANSTFVVPPLVALPNPPPTLTYKDAGQLLYEEMLLTGDDIIIEAAKNALIRRGSTPDLEDELEQPVKKKLKKSKQETKPATSAEVEQLSQKEQPVKKKPKQEKQEAKPAANTKAEKEQDALSNNKEVNDLYASLIEQQDAPLQPSYFNDDK
ncbi:hypothetical protein BC567DRAFT_18982 [Phyllosticta citribraziliensis]